MIWKRLLLTVALIALVSETARGDIILGFTPDGSVTNFNVPVGQTVQVPLYLIERNQAPLSGNILANFGLVGAGVRVDYGNTLPGGASGTSAGIDPPGWFSPGGYPIVNNNPNGLMGNLDVYGTTFGAAAPAVGSPPAVRFGTLTFTGNTIGNVTTLMTTNTQPSTVAHFTAGDLAGTILEHQSYGNIFWAGGNPANAPLHYSSTITVTPVPEPTTILGVCAAAGGLYAWRRKRSKKN
jgi:hypothetical protein